MDQDIEFQLTSLLGEPILKVVPLSGGDISTAHLLHTKNARLFCKVHGGGKAYEMFLAEKTGLVNISNSNTIKTPEVVLCEQIKNGACLVLEFVESKTPSGKDLEKLGQQLAALHQLRSEYFGFHSDNFIGSLPQSNKTNSDWGSFYTHERLLPQLQLAESNKLLADKEIPGANRILAAVNKFFSNISASLLHGDLWGGNYLISSEGEPYLIDPAVYYGHSEVDISMTRLFSGFGSEFYSAYYEVLPKTVGETERQELYQLYYLLVHLNLFGRSYYPAVSGIIQRYF